MRYPASEKLEIINLVEQSHLPTKRTLDRLGIPRRTFYRWYDRYLGGGPEALEDRSSAPSRVWNRIPTAVHDQLIEMALEESELSPRELAVSFTDQKGYFVSEASVYRLLKAHDLITSPAYVVIKAATSSTPKQCGPTRCGKPTSPTSRSSVGAGCTYPPCSMITRATSSLGSCAAPCRPRTLATRWTRCIRLRSGPFPSQTPAAQRQRPELHRW